MRDNNLALFESADDRLIITELGEEAGLAQLLAANPVLFQEITKDLDVHAQATTKDNENDIVDANTCAQLICLSLLADLNPTPSATAAVRDHLNGGKLQDLINTYSAKDAPSKLNGKYSPGYVLSLLGACAMTLGCNIPALFMEYLKDMTDIQDGAKMPFEARNQLFEALYGPRKYENGKAYDFTAKEECTKYGSGLSESAYDSHVKSMNFNIQVTLEKVHMKSAMESCAICPSKAAKDGSGLLTCGRCKVRKYCSKAHQKMHWKIHKLVCRASVAKDDESIG
ncbi:Egl nine 1 [Elasticomyces elasticus]|nr:Egl nine 1 [Elasticomyces elasticus]